IISLKTLCGAETDLILILDKGNNSKKNFSYMEGKINWIGVNDTSTKDFRGNPRTQVNCPLIQHEHICRQA
ncbi:MAG: hypothetical protein U9P00_12455, partial [Pseudomonadota bacterium]|nr:hypothetical protein [Pseudomonadota bacterium]